ncbi:hypothetical protein E2562_020607 [Oryza meyeriana var. granulata]|uniref:Uncharacterized protein n=1 Tax=Oryza meyeriana var. granulata TaxID=110450 RepID=A0A6G1DXA8_9ORYZ|nr:hypothetical protein E2562_020607 [Oryza meyeriana var. granulata]
MGGDHYQTLELRRDATKAEIISRTVHWRPDPAVSYLVQSYPAQSACSSAGNMWRGVVASERQAPGAGSSESDPGARRRGPEAACPTEVATGAGGGAPDRGSNGGGRSNGGGGEADPGVRGEKQQRARAAGRRRRPAARETKEADETQVATGAAESQAAAAGRRRGQPRQRWGRA